MEEILQVVEVLEGKFRDLQGLVPVERRIMREIMEQRLESINTEHTARVNEYNAMLCEAQTKTQKMEAALKEQVNASDGDKKQTEQLVRAHARIAHLEEQLGSMQEQHRALQQHAASIEHRAKETQESNMKLRQLVETHIHTAEKPHAASTTELSAVQQQLYHAQQRIATMERDYTAIQTSHCEEQRHLNASIASMERHLQDKDVSMTKLHAQIASLKQEAAAKAPAGLDQLIQVWSQKNNLVKVLVSSNNKETKESAMMEWTELQSRECDLLAECGFAVPDSKINDLESRIKNNFNLSQSVEDDKTIQISYGQDFSTLKNFKFDFDASNTAQCASDSDDEVQLQGPLF